MTLNEVMTELEKFGSEQTRKIYKSHGAVEPYFGVKVSDMKVLQKKIKKDYELALELYETGNSDAMYFAGLIADEKQMTIANFEKWIDGAYWYYLSEYTVPHVLAESQYAIPLALKWLESENDNAVAAAWATISAILAIKPNDELDMEWLKSLLNRVETSISEQTDRVRYVMNGYVISIGTNIPELQPEAISTAEKIGKVEVDMGGTACKVPLATAYIQKFIDKGKPAKKRKTFRK
jgi:3-methyladenine DNA glycosylase AlkD